MKTTFRIFAPAVGLAVCSPALRAADEKSPPMKEEKREIRVITGSPHVERRVIVGRAGDKMEKEMVTFLGVEAQPVSTTLTVQLGLPKGAGLVVTHVAPDSAAAGALQEHDILLKLDDQLVVEGRQLSVLVRNHKEGDEVTLTYVRGGKQATAKVKLGQHEVPKISMNFENFVPSGSMNGVTIPFGGGDRFEMTVPGLGASGSPVDMNRLLSLIDRAHTREPSSIRIDRNDGPGFRSMSVNTGYSTMLFSDDDGSLELTTSDGKKSLVAKNSKGEPVFSGGVTTPEERRAMPPAVRERLEKLEGMRDVTFRTDGNFQGAETKIIRPRGQGIALPPQPLPPPARAPLFF